MAALVKDLDELSRLEFPRRFFQLLNHSEDVGERSCCSNMTVGSFAVSASER